MAAAGAYTERARSACRVALRLVAAVLCLLASLPSSFAQPYPRDPAAGEWRGVRQSPFGPADEAQDLHLLIHGGASRTATVHVDNLRFGGEPTEDWNRTPPRNIEVYQPDRSVGRWRKLEVGVQFEAAYSNLFNPADVLVEGVFTGPDESVRTVRGFFAGYARSERFGPAWPIFLIRFAPTQVGRWTFFVRVRNRDGQSAGRRRRFYVTDSRSDGFARVSGQDPRFFELDSGEFFYPIGQNVAWAQDYEPYLARQSETGQNWVRVWLCPWHVQLELSPGRYDLDAARRLDGIVDLAASYGLRVQLVLVHHGMLTDESWEKNPYNWSNGGPCYLASEFFSNPEARALFKQRLDYIVARWGYSTALFAWELFNEVDFTRYATFDHVVDWHEEMSSYLKQIDPNQHLVTTSLSRESSDTRLWRLAGIDFIQAHLYGPDPARQVLEQYLATRDIKKPFFVGEYGRSTSAAEADHDHAGRDLREALWGTFMLPTAGNIMPWWWDSLIRPHNLERLFEPLSRFAEGVDRRAQNYEFIETAILVGNGSQIAVRGLLNYHSCYLWLHQAAGADPDAAGSALIPDGKEFALDGMLGGKYAVTVMDTATGRILRRSVLTCERGKLVVALPGSEDDVAVKLQYQGSPRSRFLNSPELLRLEGMIPRPADRP